MKCRSGGVCRLCLSNSLSSGPPDYPSICSFEGSSQAVWVNISAFFFKAIEIAVVKIFMYIIVILFWCMLYWYNVRGRSLRLYTM